MKKESLFQALEHIRLLCQIKGTLDINYVSALYEEIKDDFTDKTILQAAHEIVRTENTYGLFPSVKTWLEHSSKQKQRQMISFSQGAEFIQFIIEMIEMDAMYFDINITKQDFKKKFGWHGCNALMKAGYKLSYIRNVGRADNFTKQNILRECKIAWDKTDDKPLNNEKLLLENTQNELINYQITKD